MQKLLRIVRLSVGVIIVLLIVAACSVPDASPSTDSSETKTEATTEQAQEKNNDAANSEESGTEEMSEKIMNNSNNSSNVEKAKALVKAFETGDTSALDYVSDEIYIQHNLGVPDGKDVLNNFVTGSPTGVTATTVRAIADGDLVILHNVYGGVWNNGTPQVSFDVFHFEDGLIVEHWDNLQNIVSETASGRTQTEGTSEVTDLEKTAENKLLVQKFYDVVIIGQQYDNMSEFFDDGKYMQHNPMVPDDLSGFQAVINSTEESGAGMKISKLHTILGEGNFILGISEGALGDKPYAFYDLFRVENGYLAEHWDVMAEIPPESERQNDNGKFGF